MRGESPHFGTQLSHENLENHPATPLDPLVSDAHRKPLKYIGCEPRNPGDTKPATQIYHQWLYSRLRIKVWLAYFQNQHSIYTACFFFFSDFRGVMD